MQTMGLRNQWITVAVVKRCNLRFVVVVTILVQVAAKSYYFDVFFIITSLNGFARYSSYLAFYLVAFWIAEIMHFMFNSAIRTKATIIAVFYYYCYCYCCCEKANPITAMAIAAYCHYCVVSYSIFDYCSYYSYYYSPLQLLLFEMLTAAIQHHSTILLAYLIHLLLTSLWYPLLLY